MMVVIRASSQLPPKLNEEKKPHGQVVRGTGTRIYPRNYRTDGGEDLFLQFVSV